MNYKLITTEKLKLFKTRFFNLFHSKITGYVTNDKKYKIDVDENGNYYVDVPWTDTNADYVEKVKIVGYQDSEFDSNYGYPQKIDVDTNGNYYVRISKGEIHNTDWGFNTNNGYLQINANRFAKQLFKEAINIQGVIVDDTTGNIYLGVTQHKVGNPTLSVTGYTLYGNFFLADTCYDDRNNHSRNEANLIKQENIEVTQAFNFGPSETITVTATTLSADELASIGNSAALAVGRAYWTNSLSYGSSSNGNGWIVTVDGAISNNSGDGYYAVRLGFKNPFANRT